MAKVSSLDDLRNELKDGGEEVYQETSKPQQLKMKPLYSEAEYLNGRYPNKQEDICITIMLSLHAIGIYCKRDMDS